VVVVVVALGVLVVDVPDGVLVVEPVDWFVLVLPEIGRTRSVIVCEPGSGRVRRTIPEVVPDRPVKARELQSTGG
jgi:hypothetical protein